MLEVTRICFIRHGETDWNVEQRVQGHIDRPLNAKGMAQADALARRFLRGQAAALYCSDLLRARQTAEPVARALDLDIRVDQALRERNFGCCEGLTLQEIAAQSPEDARAIESGEPDFAAAGGESRRQHQARVLACIEALARAHPAQAVVVVTHGGVLDVIRRRARRLPLQSPRDYAIPNAGINWIAINGDAWEIESWADTVHLD